MEDFVFQEAYNNLSDPTVNFSKIDISFLNTKSNKYILRKLSKKLLSSKDFSEILPNISDFYEKINRTNLYKEINIKFDPIENVKDSIHFKINFKEKPFYFAQIAQNFDQKSEAILDLKGGFRNIFGLFDKTIFEYSKSLSRKNSSNFHFCLEFPLFFYNSNFQIGY